MTVLSKSHQRKEQEEGRDEEKEEGRYLMLILGLCLEDKIN